jgi:hypothetical protein
LHTLGESGLFRPFLSTAGHQVVNRLLTMSEETRRLPDACGCGGNACDAGDRHSLDGRVESAAQLVEDVDGDAALSSQHERVPKVPLNQQGQDLESWLVMLAACGGGEGHACMVRFLGSFAKAVLQLRSDVDVYGSGLDRAAGEVVRELAALSGEVSRLRGDVDEVTRHIDVVVPEAAESVCESLAAVVAAVQQLR